MNFGKKSWKDVDSNESLQLELSVRTNEKPVCKTKKFERQMTKKWFEQTVGFLEELLPPSRKGNVLV